MPSGGEAARSGLWEGLLQQNPCPWFWEGGGSEGSLLDQARVPRSRPCSMHNKDLFSLHLVVVPAALQYFGVAWREGKLQAHIIPHPFRVSGEPGAAAASLQPRKGVWGAKPSLDTPKEHSTPSQPQHIPGGLQG